jgi:hypothetical protein
MPGGKVMSMHRMLVQPRRNEVVDHIDHNGLNNRRCNVRPCTQRQNLANTRPSADAKIYDNTPHYIGVYRRGDKWRASIGYRGKYYYLGTFADPVEAAKARDKKAYEFWGPYAYLNFPEDYPPPAARAARNPKQPCLRRARPVRARAEKTPNPKQCRRTKPQGRRKKG